MPMLFEFLKSMINFIGISLLAIATGPDLFRYIDVADVECEVIPSGMRGTVVTVPPPHPGRESTSSGSRPLMHSVHELEAAREATANEILLILRTIP